MLRPTGWSGGWPGGSRGSRPAGGRGGFLLGLLAYLPRKNCWSIAEHTGDADPHGMQHLLNWVVWDTDGARDDLRDYVTAHLGDADAVLVVDETGDLKKGTDTVSVQRCNPARS